jgi:hypothetical protein
MTAPKKRVAKVVVEKPPFERMETGGRIATLPAVIDGTIIDYAASSRNSGSTIKNLPTSIHVPLIPVQYLAARRSNCTDEEYVNEDMEIDLLHSRGWQAKEKAGESFRRLISRFDGTGIHPYKDRGCLSLVHENQPYVLAVILPENLVYQKLYILRHKKIDLRKVIVLIDRDLDSTAFPKRMIRQIYMQELVPLIKSTAVQAWKVPLSFIKNNCFYGEFSLISSSIKERRDEREEIVATFRSVAKVAVVGPYGTSIPANVFEGPAPIITGTPGDMLPGEVPW